MSDVAKDIAVSVAGSLGGNKVADKLHLGNGGHMASGIAGGILAGDAERKVEEKKNEKNLAETTEIKVAEKLMVKEQQQLKEPNDANREERVSE